VDVKEVISSGVIELYVLGIANPQQIQLVEDCIANYPEITLAEINAVEEALATNATAYAKEPPAHLQQQIEEKLFAATNAEQINNSTSDTNGTPITTTKVVAINKYFKYATAACIALLIGSVVANFILIRKIKNTNKELTVAQNKINTQTELNQDMEKQFAVISNKYAQAVSLAGTPNHPDALAKIYWIKNTGDVYIDPTNLPKAPKGMQYQFWGIVNGQPVDGGLIFKNGKLKIEKLKTFGKAEAFAITLEKEGGVKEPTMPNMYVMAKT
jgi:anti-sigma-K factor RskA